MTWFETLTGFREESPEQVRTHITVDGNKLKSHVNGREFICGELEMPSLGGLRERIRSNSYNSGRLSVREVVADAQQLHLDERNNGALFQVASQFNLLEMTSPNVAPECGVGIYENDHTQGPACAVAAGAGTIYRNYFAPLNGQIGQTANNQINCLADLGEALGNSDDQLWKMQNGYAMATQEGLFEINQRLRGSSEHELDQLRQLLRIGIHWNTQVTLEDSRNLVTQAYCSALPVAYSTHPPSLWSEFASLILEASYEATICAAILNSCRNGNNRLFLTLLGGGVFGNEIGWIIDAVERALKLYKDADLDVAIVSYRSSNPYVKQLVTT